MCWNVLFKSRKESNRTHVIHAQALNLQSVAVHFYSEFKALRAENGTRVDRELWRVRYEVLRSQTWEIQNFKRDNRMTIATNLSHRLRHSKGHQAVPHIFPRMACEHPADCVTSHLMHQHRWLSEAFNGKMHMCSQCTRQRLPCPFTEHN